jgi:hypothetical protein
MNLDGVFFTGRVMCAVPHIDEAAQYMIQVFQALAVSHKIDTIFPAMAETLYPKFGELEFTLLETRSGQPLDLDTPFLFSDPTFSAVLLVDFAAPEHVSDYRIH